VLLIAGLHVPVMPLTDVVGNGGMVAPEQYGPTAAKVGVVNGRTVTLLDTEASTLPQASVAVHVSVTVVPAAGGPGEYVEIFEVPVIRQLPVSPLVNVKVPGAGIALQATIMSAGAVIVGKAAGLTVIVLETDAIALPQASVAVHVSVITPPVQGSGAADNVDRLEVPLIRHPPASPLVNGSVLAAGTAPHATIMFEGAVITGREAGEMVITCVNTVLTLRHLSLETQVLVYVPPQLFPTNGPDVFVRDNTEQLSVGIGWIDCAAARPAASPQATVLSRLPAGVDQVGGVISNTVNDLEQLETHPAEFVIFSVKVYGVPHPPPAVTVTVWPLVAPGIVPFPEIDHK